MEIITRDSEVQISTLKYGDVCQTASGRIFMIVDGSYYSLKTDSVLLVDLQTGRMDGIRSTAVVRPVKLVAREE